MLKFYDAWSLIPTANLFPHPQIPCSFRPWLSCWNWAHTPSRKKTEEQAQWQFQWNDPKEVSHSEAFIQDLEWPAKAVTPSFICALSLSIPPVPAQQPAVDKKLLLTTSSHCRCCARKNHVQGIWGSVTKYLCTGFHDQSWSLILFKLLPPPKY